MNITKPDKESAVYKQFVEMTNQRVSSAMTWLESHNIEYVWNYYIDNHLYRLYIPNKDLLLDFETYSVNNPNYNWIRICPDTDMIRLLEQLFPENSIDTQDLDIWHIKQIVANKFLRKNGVSPIYDKNVLRIAFIKDSAVYQCMILKENKIIANVTQHGVAVPYGTYMLLRYLTEMMGFDEVIISEQLDNSYTETLYKLIKASVVSVTPKRKIWWSPGKTVWRTNCSDNFVPFYLPEVITYKYHIK